MSQRGTPTPRRWCRIFEALHFRHPREYAPHHGALHALSLPVGDAHEKKALLLTGANVLLHDGRDVGRREGVKVEIAGDGQFDGLVGFPVQARAPLGSPTGAPCGPPASGS